MNTTTRALRYHENGNPASILRLEEIALPSPGTGEVLVEMLAAPINPADLNTLEGKYGKQPPLPAVGGLEGVGSIVSSGKMVLVPSSVGSWREKAVIAEDELIAIPDGVDPLQAAMMRVNPPTAWLMLENFVKLEPGEWIIQNAANSAVGRCVIQIARARGLKTINIVRREELIAELEAEGGDVVLTDTREAFGTIKERTGNAKIRLGLNAVGGDNAVGVAAALTTGGVLVTYGAMAKQPVKLPAGLLIFKDIRAVGFWVTRYFDGATREEKERVIGELVALSQAGKLSMPVEKVYSIEQATEAMEHAQQNKRSGKILFQFAS